MHPRYTGTYTAILITVYAKPLSLVPLWATYSVRSRGRAESPAAWRDPVAFENGTRPDTTSPCSLLCCLHRRNKARKSAGSYIYIYIRYLHHYPADSNKRVSIPPVDKGERNGVEWILGTVEWSVACGVAWSKVAFESEPVPASRIPKRVG